MDVSMETSHQDWHNVSRRWAPCQLNQRGEGEEMEIEGAINSVQHQKDYKTALKCSGLRVDAVQICSKAPRDRLRCPPIGSSHTLVSPHHLHLSITFPPSHSSLSTSFVLISSPRFPLSTPKACLFPHLTSSADFSTLLPLQVLLSSPSLSLSVSFPPLSLSYSLPRCAKWKLSQRPEVAIVTCHSNHSPSCVSPSHRRGLGASAALLCSSQSGVSVR